MCFPLKNLHFLLKNLHFLLKNLDFILNNVDFIDGGKAGGYFLKTINLVSKTRNVLFKRMKIAGAYAAARAG